MLNYLLNFFVRNVIGWGQGVLNLIGWGASGQQGGQETTNLLTESGDFLITESNDFLISELLIFMGGFGSIYSNSWSGETLLER
jgi:hypothetical protein